VPALKGKFQNNFRLEPYWLMGPRERMHGGRCRPNGYPPSITSELFAGVHPDHGTSAEKRAFRLLGKVEREEEVGNKRKDGKGRVGLSSKKELRAKI